MNTDLSIFKNRGSSSVQPSRVPVNGINKMVPCGNNYVNQGDVYVPVFIAEGTHEKGGPTCM